MYQTEKFRRAGRRSRLAALIATLMVTATLAVVAGATPAGATPTTFTVDSLLDAPDANPGNGVCATAAAACTLRAAIEEANATPANPATIAFSVAGVTRPTTAYPALAASTTVDGSTAPGYTAATGPTFEISCQDAVGSAKGLTVDAPDSTVQGLSIADCQTSLTLTEGADHAHVYGTWINGDPALGIWSSNIQVGIVSHADDVVIGGPLVGQGNLVNAENQAIEVDGPSGDGINHATIQGNRIGTYGDGSFAGESLDGVAIGPNVNVLVGGTAAGTGNVIIRAGNAVSLADNGAGITIQGNQIGAPSKGKISTQGNAGGISVYAATGPKAGDTLPLIGGTTRAAGNMISGSSYYGIQLHGPAVIQGNLIGTDPTGKGPSPNGYGGIDFQDDQGSGIDGTLIGGSAPGAGNLISGNTGPGITIEGSGYKILGNLIGTDITGTKALPNGQSNIDFANTHRGPGQIGGVAPGEGNTIAYSPRAGVNIGSRTPTVQGISVRGNRIFANVGLDIDLYQHSTTYVGDADQINPTITSTVTAAGSTTVTGTVRSDKVGPLLVDVYASDTCQAGYGTGEAKEYLGTITVPYAGGNVSTPFTGVVTAPTVGSVITATTTQATNGTSQFSPCAPYSDIQTTVRQNRTRATLGDRLAVEFTVTNAGPDPAADLTVGLGRSTGASSAAPDADVVPSQGSVVGSSWNVGTLASGASAQLCLRGAVTQLTWFELLNGVPREVPTSFFNDVGRAPTSTTADPYRGNDFASEDVTIDKVSVPTPVDPTVCPTPTISVDDGALTRPASGTAPMAFTVHLSAAQGADTTVDYQTTPGSAAAVDDFTSTSGTLTIPAGQTSAEIDVPITGGQTDEPTKTFTLDLSNPHLADLADSHAVGTIEANHLLAGCPDGSSANRRFVCHLYADALGRTPDPGGVTYWTARLDANTPRNDVARRFLGEPEALRKVADRPYVRYLGRHGTTAELQAWATKYAAHTAGPQDTRVALLAGAEYFALADDSNTTFVEHLYRDVFRRAADPSGVTYWVGRLTAGSSRATVAVRFVAEPEGRRKLVSDLYLRFLRREATTAEANDWVAKLAAGKTEVDVGVGVVSSSEYFDR